MAFRWGVQKGENLTLRAPAPLVANPTIALPSIAARPKTFVPVPGVDQSKLEDEIRDQRAEIERLNAEQVATESQLNAEKMERGRVIEDRAALSQRRTGLYRCGVHVDRDRCACELHSGARRGTHPVDCCIAQ